MLTEAVQEPLTAALVGFESSGKSALFRGLTGQATGDEANFRGSTVMSRSKRISSGLEIADIPGVRVKDDSRTTQEALASITAADIAILVVRATHASEELPLLLEAVDLKGKRALLILTFADKMPEHRHELISCYSDWLGIPVHAVDARGLRSGERQGLLAELTAAKPVRSKVSPRIRPSFPIVQPATTWFEHAVWGRALAILVTFMIFALPVFLAYLLSSWLQPLVDRGIITPARTLSAGAPALVQSLIVGDYGLLSLGLYSFLWAFPVVLLIGVSVALTEESGIKDRITDALDAWMSRIGLSGRDLIPVLSGFGCNVVAVFQSRACSACTRKSCVSLIAFGSACSYQIGASLSIFGSSGHPWLFVPYLLTLALVGAIHTRIWNRHSPRSATPIYTGKTFLQKPGWRAMAWRVRGVTKQFLLQAMPIFLGICVTAAILQFTGLLDRLSGWIAPVMSWFHLPAEAANAVVFSILRKDGLLILNQGEGGFLQSLHAGQIFVLVYLASTLTACLVTLGTVRKELGWSFASSLAGKQAVTSLVSTFILALAMSF